VAARGQSAPSGPVVVCHDVPAKTQQGELCMFVRASQPVSQSASQPVSESPAFSVPANGKLHLIAEIFLTDRFGKTLCECVNILCETETKPLSRLSEPPLFVSFFPFGNDYFMKTRSQIQAAQLTDPSC